jgi:hypothetical protein
MKKLLLILLCLPMIGFGQLDFGYEGPIPNIICEGDSAMLLMFDNTSFVDTPVTFNYTIDGVAQTPITTSSYIVYINQQGHYIITSWLNSSGTFNSSNSYLPFDMMSPLVVDSCITNTQFNILSKERKIIKILDLLGRETKQTNQPLFYIYNDGTVEKRIVIE